MSELYWYSLLITVVGYTAGFVFLFKHFHSLSTHQMNLMDIVLKRMLELKRQLEVGQVKPELSELGKKLSKDKANIGGLGEESCPHGFVIGYDDGSCIDCYPRHGKTHIFGGNTMSGDAVCAPTCWCKEGEE